MGYRPEIENTMMVHFSLSSLICRNQKGRNKKNFCSPANLTHHHHNHNSHYIHFQHMKWHLHSHLSHLNPSGYSSCRTMMHIKIVRISINAYIMIKCLHHKKIAPASHLPLLQYRGNVKLITNFNTKCSVLKLSIYPSPSYPIIFFWFFQSTRRRVFSNSCLVVRRTLLNWEGIHDNRCDYLLIIYQEECNRRIFFLCQNWLT